MIKFAIGYTVGFGVYLLMTTVVPLFVVDINPSKEIGFFLFHAAVIDGIRWKCETTSFGNSGVKLIERINRVTGPACSAIDPSFVSIGRNVENYTTWIDSLGIIVFILLALSVGFQWMIVVVSKTNFSKKLKLIRTFRKATTWVVAGCGAACTGIVFHTFQAKDELRDGSNDNQDFYLGFGWYVLVFGVVGFMLAIWLNKL
jgi:hypothetical protein